MDMSMRTFRAGVDSGSVDHVSPGTAAPEIDVVPSKASEKGVTYESASGHPLPNKGEQSMVLRTKGDHTAFAATFQTADVTKPRMSVARMCGQGHRVEFLPRVGAGGPIHTRAGEVIKFIRDKGGYTLDAELDPQASRDFRRQGDP